MRITYVNEDHAEKFDIIINQDSCWVDRQEVVRYLESLLKDMGEGWGYFRSEGGSIVNEPGGGGTL